MFIFIYIPCLRGIPNQQRTSKHVLPVTILVSPESECSHGVQNQEFHKLIEYKYLDDSGILMVEGLLTQGEAIVSRSPYYNSRTFGIQVHPQFRFHMYRQPRYKDSNHTGNIQYSYDQLQV